MSEDRIQQLEAKIAELEKKLAEEVENRKKIARAVLKISERIESHMKGEMTLEDVQNCVNKVNEFLSIVQGLSIPSAGSEQGGIMSLMSLLMKQHLASKESDEGPEVKRLSKKESEKLREVLEDDEGESEDNE